MKNVKIGRRGFVSGLGGLIVGCSPNICLTNPPHPILAGDGGFGFPDANGEPVILNNSIFPNERIAKPKKVVIGYSCQSVGLGQIGGAGRLDGPLKRNVPIPREDIRAYRDTFITDRVIQPWHSWQFRQPTRENWAGSDTRMLPRLVDNGWLVKFIETGQGATSLALNWKARTGNLYLRYVDSFNRAIVTDPNPWRDEDTQKILIHDQCQQDCKAWADVYAFKDNLVEFAACVRQDLQGMSNAKFVIPLAHRGLRISGATQETVDLVRQAQIDFVESDPIGAIAIETSDVQQHVDLTHWAESAYLISGVRFADAILTMMENDVHGFVFEGGGEV